MSTHAAPHPHVHLTLARRISASTALERLQTYLAAATTQPHLHPDCVFGAHGRPVSASHASAGGVVLHHLQWVEAGLRGERRGGEEEDGFEEGLPESDDTRLDALIAEAETAEDDVVAREDEGDVEMGEDDDAAAAAEDYQTQLREQGEALLEDEIGPRSNMLADEAEMTSPEAVKTTLVIRGSPEESKKRRLEEMQGDTPGSKDPEARKRAKKERRKEEKRQREKERQEKQAEENEDVQLTQDAHALTNGDRVEHAQENSALEKTKKQRKKKDGDSGTAEATASTSKKPAEKPNGITGVHTFAPVTPVIQETSSLEARSHESPLEEKSNRTERKERKDTPSGARDSPQEMDLDTSTKKKKKKAKPVDDAEDDPMNVDGESSKKKKPTTNKNDDTQLEAAADVESSPPKKKKKAKKPAESDPNAAPSVNGAAPSGKKTKGSKSAKNAPSDDRMSIDSEDETSTLQPSSVLKSGSKPKGSSSSTATAGEEPPASSTAKKKKTKEKSVNGASPMVTAASEDDRERIEKDKRMEEHRALLAAKYSR